MYNGMIVTLSSFLDVTDLEVDRSRVRERRVTRKMRKQRKLMKRRKSRRQKSIKLRIWNVESVTSYLDLETCFTSAWRRNEVSSRKSITTNWTKIYRRWRKKRYMRRNNQEGRICSFCISSYVVFPWKSKIKKEEGKYGGYIWSCHNLVEEVIVGAIKRYWY